MSEATALPPLSDLHRHLDGSLRRTTLEELARPFHLEIRPDLAFSPGIGLQAALERFATTLAVLQTEAAVARVAAEICEDAAIDGVTTLEIRFAPQLHPGASMAAIVDAALEGAAGRAGLILCALYGEPPSLLDDFVALARTRPGVVGLDLAGGPRTGDRFSMTDYIRPMREARRAGLGITIHAGEGRPPDEIRQAIDDLGAHRIGHGTSLLQDPAVLERVVAQGITIEACITSNWQTGAIPAPVAHPLAEWLKAGVRASVNTDNTLLSQVTASSEHRLALTLPGMTSDLLAQAIGWGHAGAFRR